MKTGNKRVQKKNREWMRNKDQLKHPKVYNVSMIRKRDGSFHLIGNEARVFMRKNQHSGEWVNVNTRDLMREMRQTSVTSF